MSGMIKGKVFVLGENIDTDQMIPAEHLVYSLEDPEEKKFYGKFALSGVPATESGLPQGQIPFTAEGKFESDYKIIVASNNFGCGSSREHAPAALQIAGVQAVIATSYARIFYRNSVDGGFLIPYESKVDLSKEVSTNDKLEINEETSEVKNLTTGKTYQLNPLGSVSEIVKAGGIFKYARENGMMQ